MKKEIVKFLVLLMVALGAGPIGAAVYQWSLTASSNATADPTINWSEGQSPSSVNDSARAMMAALAGYRNDTAGAISATGTSSAYVVATSQGFSSTAATRFSEITFIAPSTNAAGVTLNVDGVGALPINGTDGVPVPAGTLIGGGVYTVTSYTVEFILRGLYGNPYSIPLGGILWSTAPTAPNANFVAPSGQCISTTTYATYWVQQGSPASGACPGGQFAIIDMSGRVPAALDNLNGVIKNRMTSSSTGCGTAFTTVGAVCANGVEGSSTTLAQLPTNITVSTGGVITVGATGAAAIPIAPVGAGIASGQVTNGSGSDPFPRIAVGLGWTSTTSFSTSGPVISTSNNTSGTATPRVQPTIGLIPYLRII